MSISEISIKRPVATAMFYIGVILLGIVSLTQLPVDLLPNLSYPKLTIRTFYTDIPPTEIEKLITIPIEEAAGTISRVRRVRSISREGVSLVVLEFLWGTNMDIAALNVREKLDNLRWILPREAGRPTILRMDPRSQPIMSLSVTGVDFIQLKEFTRNVIKRRLEQINGVALATVIGGLEREIQINVDSRKLLALGISIHEVASALASANQNLPGGTIRKGRYRYALRTLGEFQSISEIGNVVVARGDNGSIVPLKKVAQIVDGFKERDSITRFNGRESIGLMLTKEAGANTVDVSRRVRKVLTQLRSEYPKVSIAVADDEARFISSAISNVLQALIVGGILAFLVLFFFMHDIRNPINIATSIPIAILATFVLMFFSHVSLNMISLGGLALGVGMLVDNSIVVLENIFRHEREGEDPITAGVVGSREVAMAVTASTLTTVSVFFPIIYVKGIAGQLFRDQSLTVTFSLLTSLVVSLTLLPMLASRFYRKTAGVRPSKEKTLPEVRLYESLFRKKTTAFPMWQKFIHPVRRFLDVTRQFPLNFFKLILNGIKPFFGFFFKKVLKIANALLQPFFRISDRWYDALLRTHEKLLRWSLDHQGKLLLITGCALIATLLLGLTIDRQLLPKVEQNRFTVRVNLPPGTSLETTNDTVGKIENTLLSNPGVKTIFSRIGTAASQTNILLKDSGRNLAQIQVQVRPGRHASEKVMAYLQQKLGAIKGIEITYESGNNILSQFIGTSRADIAIKITGEDLSTLRRLLQKVEERVRTVTGLTNIHSSYKGGRPEIRITIDPEAAGRFGLSSEQIARFIRNRMHGTVATYFKEFNRKVDVLVRPEVNERNELSDLLQSEIISGGIAIPVRQLIHTALVQGPVEIRRENQTRELVLYGNIAGRGVSSAIREVDRRVSGINTPVNCRIAVAGEREEIKRSFRSLILVFLLAAGLVYMILAAQFESLIYPFVIGFTVPLASIGVILALFLTGQSFNIISLIGIVVLMGIVVNDAIVEVDFINQERSRGRPLRESILEAGRKRLRPIVMTSVTTVFGLLPMAVGVGSGAALRRPLAIVVIGGLITATFLTLIVVPVLYGL